MSEPTPAQQAETLEREIMNEVEKFADVAAPDNHELTKPHIEWMRAKIAALRAAVAPQQREQDFTAGWHAGNDYGKSWSPANPEPQEAPGYHDALHAHLGVSAAVSPQAQEMERLKKISNAAFHVVMQWGSGTEESTKQAISELEGLFQ